MKKTKSIPSQSRSSTESSSTSAMHSEAATSTTKPSEDKFKPHENPKVNKLHKKAQSLGLEFIVGGIITKDEEVISIVNKSTDPEKHGRLALYSGEKCSPTLTVMSQAQFAKNHDFTWTNDVLRTSKPTATEAQVMVKIRKNTLALLVTDYGKGVTTLDPILEDEPVFLYEGEAALKDDDLQPNNPYSFLIQKNGKTMQIDARQQRGYGGFAQHLFEKNASYLPFYELTPEDESNIAWENAAPKERLKTSSHRVFFYALSKIPPLAQIGYSYPPYYFKSLSIPMAPFSMVDGFSLKYKVKGYEMEVEYPEIDHALTITNFFDSGRSVDSKKNPNEALKTLQKENQKIATIVSKKVRHEDLGEIRFEKKQGYSFLNEAYLIRDQEIEKCDDFLSQGIMFFTITVEHLPVALYMMTVKKRYADWIQKYAGLMDADERKPDQTMQKELALLNKFLEIILTLLNPPQKQDPVITEKRKKFFEDQKATVVAHQQILDTRSQLPSTINVTTRKKHRSRLFSTYEIATKNGDIRQQEALLLRKIANAADLTSLQWFLHLCNKNISEYINKTTSAGKTPLHLASESKKETSLAVCMLLLHKKADPTLADSTKNTPYKYIASNSQLMLFFNQIRATPPGSYQIKEKDLDPDNLYPEIVKEVEEQGFKI